MYVGTEVTDVALDSEIPEDFESTLISEVAILRDKFEVLQFLQHFPATPQTCSAQYNVSLIINYGWINFRKYLMKVS